MGIASIDTQIGRYVMVASERGLTHVQPEGSPGLRRAGAHRSAASEHVLERARAAFADYFAGRWAALGALPLDPAGTEFQLRVWRALREIPVGATASYGEIARRIGCPGSARAVGSANHHNPIAIAIPCHRVIGAGGLLVGYAGGLPRKRWLLAHEAGQSSLGCVAEIERPRRVATRARDRAQPGQRRGLDLTHALP
jgi:methylated-DNA-[protein]-cysteine S-methyltransferase